MKPLAPVTRIRELGGMTGSLPWNLRGTVVLEESVRDSMVLVELAIVTLRRDNSDVVPNETDEGH